QVGGGGSLVVRGDLEGAAGAGGGLLEDQGDVLAEQPGLLGTGVFGGLELRGEVDQVTELLRSEVELLEEVPVPEVERHAGLLGRSAVRRWEVYTTLGICMRAGPGSADPVTGAAEPGGVRAWGRP